MTVNLHLVVGFESLLLICCKVLAKSAPLTLLLSNVPGLLCWLQNATFTSCQLKEGGLPVNTSAANDIAKSRIMESFDTLKTTIILGSRQVSHVASAVCGQAQEQLQHSWAGMAHGPLLAINS